MKSKTMILLVVAIGCGLVASYMTSKLLAERSSSSGQEEEKVKVLVARQSIPFGTLIKEPEKLFDWKSYTKGEEPKKGIQDMNELKGQVLNKTLNAEQFVTKEDLTDKASAGIVHNLPKGMRAIAIKANAESVGGGFVHPNCRVDIISTRNVDTEKGSEKVAQILLQNMLVLAVDQIIIKDPEKQAILPSTVTLAATPEEATRLALAANLGELRLMLRNNFEDQEKVKSIVAKSSELSGSKSGDKPADGSEESGPGGLPAGASAKLPTLAESTPPDDAGKKAPEVVEEPVLTHVTIIRNGDEITKQVVRVDKNGNPLTAQYQKSEGDAEAPPKPGKKKAEQESAPVASTPTPPVIQPKSSAPSGSK